jgi:hypothetical protein
MSLIAEVFSNFEQVTNFSGVQDLRVEGALCVSGIFNTTTTGQLYITAPISSNISILGSEQVSGSLLVTGNSTVKGDSTVFGDLYVDGNIFITGDIISGSIVSGASIFDGTVLFNDAVTASSLTPKTYANFFRPSVGKLGVTVNDITGLTNLLSNYGLLNISP